MAEKATESGLRVSKVKRSWFEISNQDLDIISKRLFFEEFWIFSLSKKKIKNTCYLFRDFGLLINAVLLFFTFLVLRHASNVALLTDLAFRIIRLYENPVNSFNYLGLTPFHILASKPSAFRSGSHFGGWYTMIYHCKCY